ncbi:MAG: copper ion binding protein, partial [Myxococcota bacterium]
MSVPRRALKKDPHDLALEVPVSGMSCASCARGVEESLLALEQVSKAHVNLATRSVWVELSSPAADLAEIVRAISKAGFQPGVRTFEFKAHGMSCASCAAGLERTLAGVSGVIEARVDFVTRKVTVKVLEGALDERGLASQAREAGYELVPVEPKGSTGSASRSSEDESETRSLRRSALFAALLTLPIFVLEMGGHAYAPFHHWLMESIGRGPLNLLYFTLATLVQLGPGLRFYRQGLPALLRRRPDMSSLVMLSTSAAWGYSVVAAFLPDLLPEGTAHVYFEASAMIIALVLTGRYLEGRARSRTGRAVAKLLSLQPPTARVVRGDIETEVQVDEVLFG